MSQESQEQPSDFEKEVLYDQGDIERAESQKLRDLEILRDVTWVMSTRQGRRFVYNLLGNSGINGLSFNANDPHITSFNDGNRNQGIWLQSLVLERCFEEYVLMLREAKEAQDNERSNQQRSDQ